MRFGNGRHRRPRQVPAIVLAAGVTGAGIAMPLMAATGASAADAGTWDKVAQCESGRMWSANAGNGFFGGLQLTQEMWEQSGGISYAPRPDLASRAQQIAVAERILAAQGPDAWRSCAVSSGLSKDAPAPDVNPGRIQSPEPEATTPAPERTTPATPGHTTPAPDDRAPGSAGPTPGASPSPGTPAPSADPSGIPSAIPSTGSSAPASGTPGQSGDKDRKDPSAEPSNGPATPSGTPSGTPAEPAPGATPAPGDASGEAGTGKHRAEPPRSGETQRPSRDGGDGRTGVPAADGYTVQPGDNLSAIAQDHSVTGGWQTLYQKNEKVVGSDPDLIQPGQRLDVRK
ncbi:transglycosylase family protein [Streptomyces sp. NPDC026206]|uniref:transglycosylase family protein n=1 Tax=Streptomyces sp. NPDC026206 TaxID=3157089 RepID=UPI0033D5F2BC